MNRVILAALLLLGLNSCDKDDDELPLLQEPTTTELLTSGLWLILAQGFDDDSTGKIEPYENMLNPCHQDNTTLYKMDGTGNVYDNEQSCGNDSMTSFNWKLIDNNKAIDVAGNRLDIYKLTKDELHLIVRVPFLTTPVHSIYKRKP